MKYDYEADLQLSQTYEAVFADYLVAKGYTEVYVTEGYFPDYDIHTSNGLFEVKRDRWYGRTGNLCIETISCAEKQSKGWFPQTKADVLVVFYTDEDFYLLAMEDVRAMWDKCPELWTRVEIEQDSGYHTINWTIPVSFFGRISWGKI